MSLLDKLMVLVSSIESSVAKELKFSWNSKKPKESKESDNSEARELEECKLLWLESRVEAAGHIEIAQAIRFSLSGLQKGLIDDNMEWSLSTIRADIKGRWIVQREIYVREEVQALRKSLPHFTGEEEKERKESESRLNECEEELQRLNDDY